MFFVPVGLLRRVTQQANHFPNHPELHKAAADGKPESATQQHDDQDVRPQYVVDAANPII